MALQTMNRPGKVQKDIQTTVSANGEIFKPAIPLRSLYDRNKRGYTVYNLAELVQQTGRNKEGQLTQWGSEVPLFYMTIRQRNDIFKLCSPIFAVVSSRMNRISALDFDIVPDKKKEDQIADRLKSYKQIYNEYKNSMDIKYLFVKAKIAEKVAEELPDVLPDLSNFDNSLLRWKKRISLVHTSKGDEIKEFLLEPMDGVSWDSYIKSVVYNLMIHGAESTYKQCDKDTKKVQMFDSLPGGTVFKLKAPYFSSVCAYVQIVYGYEPQIFYNDEIVWMEYLKTSVQGQPIIPLECLITNVAEHLLFNERMASQADGTAPPEKLVIITQNEGLSGDFDKPIEIPMVKEEQDRIETKLNQPKKNKIITLTGNNATVIDLSSDNKLELYSSRIKDIREEVAMVFNASNMEMNLMGSDHTNGRETSETQEEIIQGKGIAPIVRLIEYNVNRNIIPQRFGYGYKFDYKWQKNEKEELELDILKQQAGQETINEQRERLNLTIFDGDEFNKPIGSSIQPGQNGISPVYTKEVK